MHDMMDQELDAMRNYAVFRFRNIKLRSGVEGEHNRAVGGIPSTGCCKDVRIPSAVWMIAESGFLISCEV